MAALPIALLMENKLLMIIYELTHHLFARVPGTGGSIRAPQGIAMGEREYATGWQRQLGALRLLL